MRSILWDFLDGGTHNGIALSHQPASQVVNISVDDDYIFNRIQATIEVDDQMGLSANPLTRKIRWMIHSLDKRTLENGYRNVIGWGPDENYIALDGATGEISAKPVAILNSDIASLFTNGNHNGVSVGYAGGTLNIGIHNQDVQDIVGMLIQNGQQHNITVAYDRSLDAVNFTVGAEGIEDIVGDLFTRYTNDSTSLSYVDVLDQVRLEINEDWLYDTIGGMLDRAQSDMLAIDYDRVSNELKLRVDEDTFRNRIADFLPTGDGSTNGVHLAYDSIHKELRIDLHQGYVEDLIGEMMTRNQHNWLSGGLYVQYIPNGPGGGFNLANGHLLQHIHTPWMLDGIRDMLIWPGHTANGIEVNLDVHNNRFEFSYIPSVIGSLIGGMVTAGTHRNIKTFYKAEVDGPGELFFDVDDVSTQQVRNALQGPGVRDGGIAVPAGDLNPEIVPGLNEQVLKMVNDKMIWGDDKDTDTRLQASQIQQVVASMFAGGQHKGLIGGYNTATGKIDFTVTFDFDVMNEAFMRQVAGRPAGQYWLVLNKENNS